MKWGPQAKLDEALLKYYFVNIYLYNIQKVVKTQYNINSKKKW